MTENAITLEGVIIDTGFNEDGDTFSNVYRLYVLIKSDTGEFFSTSLEKKAPHVTYPEKTPEYVALYHLYSALSRGHGRRVAVTIIRSDSSEAMPLYKVIKQYQILEK